MVHFVQDALRTYLFLIPLFVLFMTEIAKFIVDRIQNGEWVRKPFEHGGMPSAHSAFVTSLLIVIFQKTGMQSVEFAIAVVFSGIVWYDAMAVRGEVGKQAKALNSLQQLYKLAENVGHSFAEVIGGIAFGGAITILGIWLS